MENQKNYLIFWMVTWRLNWRPKIQWRADMVAIDGIHIMRPTSRSDIGLWYVAGIDWIDMKETVAWTNSGIKILPSTIN